MKGLRAESRFVWCSRDEVGQWWIWEVSCGLEVVEEAGLDEVGG